MENIKWSDVLVEWVNCLNISSPIQCLNDLKNEEFFGKLLSLITGNYTSECISLPDFLKKHYPDYQLAGESPLLADSVELTNTCSLLLHYACVVDGRPQLTGPLCRALPPAAQLRVRAFLEVLALAPVVSRPLLSLALLNTQPPPHTSGDNTLHDFFRTPHKKTMEAHRQQVKNLESQLEMERFEKEELQDELALQQRANEKLEKTIAEKKAEIRSLRAQLTVAEGSGGRSPHSPYRDGRAEARRLRQELASLEKYVDTSHEEHAVLSAKLDKAEARSRELELQLVRWRSDAESTSSELTVLKELHALAVAELATMKERCDELSALLAELRPPRPHDDSLDGTGPATPLNISGTIDNETLARTVVDLQLVDALDENKKLKTHINDLQQQIFQSEGQCIEIQSKLSETEFNLNYFKSENECLNQELKVNKEKLNRIDKIFKEFNKKHKLNLTDINFHSKFEQIISNYEEKIHKLKENEQKNQEEQKQLNEMLIKTEDRIKTLQSDIQICSEEISKYKSAMEDKNILIDTLTRLQSSNENKITEMVQLLDENKAKLKENELELSEKSQILENFNTEKLKNQEKINTLLKKLASTERNLEQTLTKVKQLDTLFVEKIQALNKTEKDLKLKDEINEKLILENKDLKSFIQKLEVEVTDQIKTKKKLQEKFVKTKEKLKNSEESVKKMNILEENCTKLRSELQNYEEEIKMLRLEHLSLNTNLQNEQMERKELEKKYETLKSDLERSIFKLNESLVQEVNSKIQLEEINLKISDKNMEFENEIKCLKELKENLNLQTQTLHKQLESEKEMIQKLNLTIDQLNKKLDDEKMAVEDLKEEKENLISQFITFKENVEVLQKDVESDKEMSDQIIKDLNLNIDSLNRMLEKEKMAAQNFELEIENLNLQIKTTSEYVKVLEKELESNKEMIKSMNLNIDSLNRKLDAEKMVAQNLEVEKENLISEQQIMRQKLELLQIDTTNDKTIITELNLNIDSLNRKFEEEKKATHLEKEHLCSELENMKLKLELYESDTENHKETINNLIVHKQELNEEINCLKTDLEEIKQSKVQLEENIQEINNKNIQEIKNLNEKLLELSSNRNILHKNLEIAYQSLAEKETNLEVCSKEKTQLQNDIQILETKLQNEIKENEEKQQKNLENTRKILEEKETSLKNLVLQKSELMQQLDNLQQQLDNNNCDLNEQLNDLKQSFFVEKSEMSEKISNFELETSTLRDKLSFVENEISKLLSIVEKENLNICFENQNELLIKISNLETCIFSLISDRRSGKTELGNLKQKIVELEQIILDLTQKNNLNKSTLKNNQKKLIEVSEKLDKTVTNTETVLKTHEEEIKEYKLHLSNMEQLLKEKDDFINELEKKVEEFNLEIDAQSLADKISQINNFCTDSVNKFVSLYTIVFETDFPEHSKLFDGDFDQTFDKLISEITSFKFKLKNLPNLHLEHAKTQKQLSEKHLECKKHSEELSLLKSTTSNLQKLVQECEVENKRLRGELDVAGQFDIEQKSKLVEENSQLKTEIDTLKYKRARDRDEFQRKLIEASNASEAQMQQIRTEYEEKLSKMKHKIVKLYREEVEKEKKKVCTLQQGQTEETIASLKSQLWLTGNKYTDVKRELEALKLRLGDSERRAHTLPRTETAGLSLEDETGELWNHTFLSDLKAGRCEPDASSLRLSELQARNSLCPPHLKSCYPAETQGEPHREEDIRGLDESLSSRLLPGERRRKDWGQTLYKKPGPPTPSKHGGSGRVSLQGNEVLKEHNKPSTPSRLKALFSRSGRDQENVSTSTPRSQTKRRSIFRR